MIDDFLETLEQTVINEGVIGESFPRVSEIPILARQARPVEVLVYSADKKSWRQTPIEADKTTSRIHLGSDRTEGQPGAETVRSC